MDILIYLGALFIFIYPYIDRRFHFVDILVIFFLYFDLMIYFIQHKPTFVYVENMMMLLFAIFYFIRIRTIRFPFSPIILIYILIILLFPVLQGDNINQAVRLFSVHFSSLIVLPIAYHYYSTRGNIGRLFNVMFWFILLWCVFVLFATWFKIGGEGSERVGGTFFHFGQMGNRGGLTYISFALLTVPLIIRYLRPVQKYILLALVVMIFIIFMAALKRFVFFVLAFGLVNYLLRSKIKIGYKIQILTLLAVFAVIFFTNKNIQGLFEQRYIQQGGEREFSEEAISGDIRVYEPYYAFLEVRQRELMNILIGSKQRAVMDIQHNEQIYEDREIHNEYATIILKYGFIGLFFYLSIFFALYRHTFRLNRKLNKLKLHTTDFWIVFQNFALIFVIEGMVGGHIHVTYRGLVFLFTGAISGFFSKLFILTQSSLTETGTNELKKK